MALTASSRGAYGDESPEALRRRADVLLDEMMLGGIDTGAAGPQTGATSAGNGNGVAHWPQADEMALDYDGASYVSAPNGPNGSYGHDANAGGEAVVPPRAAGSRLISAEDRYTQLASMQPAAESSSVLPDSAAPATPVDPAHAMSRTDALRAEPPSPPSSAGASAYASAYTLTTRVVLPRIAPQVRPLAAVRWGVLWEHGGAAPIAVFGQPDGRRRARRQPF